MFAVSRILVSSTPGAQEKIVARFKAEGTPKNGKVESFNGKKLFEKITCTHPANNGINTASSSSSSKQVNSQFTPEPSSTVGSNQTTTPTEGKKIKIRLSIIKDVPYSQKMNQAALEEKAEKKALKKSKEMKLKHRRISREGNFNCGRWQPEEHQRFIEAIMKYGNEWKSVQRHVGTRSSTQARSHAQKFFVKMKKANLLDFDIDFSKNSIKTLHEVANTMNSEEYFNAIKALNCVAFERKSTAKRRGRNKSPNTQNNDTSSLIFAEAPGAMNLLNNDDIFSLQTNDNTIFNNRSENSYNFSAVINNDCSSNLNSNLNSSLNTNQNTNSSYNFKFTQKKNNSNSTNNFNTIIINNNFNTYNYSVNINNFGKGESNRDLIIDPNTSTKDSNKESNDLYNNSDRKNESCLLRKRNRLNSFEGLLSLFPGLGRDCNLFNNSFNNPTNEKEEKDYIDNFNCTFKNFKNKNDFDVDRELEDMIMLSHSDDYNTGSNYNVTTGNHCENQGPFDDFLFECHQGQEK